MHVDALGDNQESWEAGVAMRPSETEDDFDARCSREQLTRDPDWDPETREPNANETKPLGIKGS